MKQEPPPPSPPRLIEPTPPSSPPLLHPYRKRKFFLELAALLGEHKPAISESSVVSSGSEPPLTALSADTSFGESLQDSLLSLQLSGDALGQHALRGVEDGGSELTASESKRAADADTLAPATTAVLLNEALVVDAGLVYGPTVSSRRRLELVDYYDADRMCELSPCWLRTDQSSCGVHTGEVHRPMLLFSLQALDEFIAWSTFQSRERQWIVRACKLARSQLVRAWEQPELLGSAAISADSRLDDVVAGKTILQGVSRHLWSIVAQYWSQYRHNYLHQHELFFGDTRDAAEAGGPPAIWARVRQLLHIYGLKLHQASRLAAEEPVTDAAKSGAGGSVRLTEHQLAVAAQGYASIDHLAFGVQYLEENGGDRRGERPTIRQQDWKLAFNDIVIHLQQWNVAAQVFPCGSFSRGAAFGSVLDVLVAVPEVQTDGDPFFTPRSSFDCVLAALIAAGIVDKHGDIQRLESYRGVCSIQFKTGRLLLDLKVLPTPASWLALVYFTGPEVFVLDFFSAVLRKSLWELTRPTFKYTYADVVETHGMATVQAIASEKDVFDLIEREYLSPAERF